MTQEETIRQLNELIQICKDSEEGYVTAAHNIQNSELETMLRGYARQRAQFAQELDSEVRRLGGEPAQSGHIGGALHRGWMDIKSALSGGDPGAMIGACVSGEDSAEAAYSRAAATDATGKTRALIESQWQQVKEAFTRLSRLKEEMKDGTRFPKNE